jgi:5-methylcytosine-specific restriction endonuclease McrA
MTFAVTMTPCDDATPAAPAPTRKRRPPAGLSWTQARAASYARSRLRLIVQLGGRCVTCGLDNPLELEFHHLHTRTWTARHTSRWQRLAHYRREAAAGEVELLCSRCNRKAGKPPVQTDAERAASEEPIPD